MILHSSWLGKRGFLRLILAMGLGALWLGALWAWLLPLDSDTLSHRVRAASDPVVGSSQILPRLSAGHPITWMTPEEEEALCCTSVMRVHLAGLL